MEQQSTNHIFMVRPANFGFNPETAESNAFQSEHPDLSLDAVKAKAIQEFDELVRRLTKHGIQVLVIEEPGIPVKTDSVFPNNWISTHSDGTMITYPMLSENRRLERDPAIIEQISSQYKVKRHVSLETYEEQDRFLEGTGSLILDRANKIAYACRSPRTDELVLEMFCMQTGYHPHLFDATDGMSQPVYHTNVMMALGETFAVICLGAIQNQKERQALVNRLESTGKEIVEITLVQMMAFAGNMLVLKGGDDSSLLVMSSQAYKSLTPNQMDQLNAHVTIVHSPLDTIETCGGGSARCMIAELFLPQK